MLNVFVANGQSPSRKQTVTTVVAQRSIYLNGGARSSVGGKSRVMLKVDLPPNTKSWFYGFSTTPGESGIANLNLAIQLSALALDPTAATQAIVQSVKVPTGSASMDVYVLDERNSDLFLQKVDNNGGSYSYYREGTVANTKQAAVAIDELNTGIVYLGLKNPATWDALNVQIEVAAVVKNMSNIRKNSLRQ